MSKTYAIADLHGRFDLLEMALACLAERAEPPATLVTLGDYVDRGPDGRKIIERLMAGLGRDGWRLCSSCPERLSGFVDGLRFCYAKVRKPSVVELQQCLAFPPSLVALDCNGDPIGQ